MSAIAKLEPYLTPEEYLIRERAAEHKSDYFNGYVVAMAGATYHHNIIAGTVNAALIGPFRGRPCISFPADMKVRIDRANLFRYPDVSAVCGAIDFFDDEQDVYCNPAVIVEVFPRARRSTTAPTSSRSTG